MVQPRRPDGDDDGRTSVAIVVCFLDEAEHLPRLLASIAAQTEPPEQLVLVDDGSRDDSVTLAEAFAEVHPYARALRRPQRSRSDDRLVDAPELQAFTWGLEQLEDSWDVVTKMDGDLELQPTLLADVRWAFEQDPALGIAGSFLSIVAPDGTPQREHTPAYHVRGPNKFYRRACYAQISPLPAFLGWDTIDELRARRRGWRTQSVQCRSGDVLHLRPTGTHDGRLRALRRWGRCAWGYGAHPALVLVGALRRSTTKPYGLGGLHYLYGWCNAAIHRYPRAEPELVAHCHHEDRARMRRALSRLSTASRA